jgi:hypothetical protein
MSLILRSSFSSSRTFAAYAPLKFFLGYLLFTLVLAIGGPTKYYQFPIGKTTIFMVVAMVVMTAGYMFGLETKMSTTRKGSSGSGLFVRRMFDLSLALSLGVLAISIVNSIVTGNLNTDFSSIGEAYLSGYENYERNTGNYSLDFIIYTISLPFNFISLVLGFYYFSTLNVARKWALTIFAVSSLLYYVLGTGKQKQLGDIVIYLLTVAALKYGARGRPIKIKWILAVAGLGIVALLAFVAVLGQRYGAIGVDISNVNRRVLDRIFIDTGHPVFAIFGVEYGLNLSMFLSYLSQGYYGLGLALDADWHWTRFQSFSYSISVITNRLFGWEWQWPNSYVYRIGLETGWGESKWHTVFTHFANDFTFPGTIVLFGMFAYVFARSWLAAIRYENPFAIMMFSLLALGAFFVPANNQLLHTPGALLTTLMVSILYIVQGPRFNIPEFLRRDRPVWRRKRMARRL